MRYIICICSVILFASCQQKKKEPSIVGTWEYVRMETYDASNPINLKDSQINQLHQSQKGMTFRFTKDKTFTASYIKNNKEEPMGKQPYELSEDNKTVILDNTGREDDKFPVIELSDSLLKINIFYSDKAYMVFKRMD